MHKRVLIVAAHPDDEVLGCGGTVIRHVQAGDTVKTSILAEGITSRDTVRDEALRRDELDRLQIQSAEAARIMGVCEVKLFGFPDNRMDRVDLLDVVKAIEQEIASFAPDLVYTHHAGDINIDHQITHRAVLTACRPLPGFSVKELLFFETPSSTEWQIQTAEHAFLPNCFVDIGAVLEQKLEALHCYDSEMRDYPHPRSYRAVRELAAHRGVTVGCSYAEAFAVGRLIR